MIYTYTYTYIYNIECTFDPFEPCKTYNFNNSTNGCDLVVSNTQGCCQTDNDCSFLLQGVSDPNVQATCDTITNECDIECTNTEGCSTIDPNATCENSCTTENQCHELDCTNDVCEIEKINDFSFCCEEKNDCEEIQCFIGYCDVQLNSCIYAPIEDCEPVYFYDSSSSSSNEDLTPPDEREITFFAIAYFVFSVMVIITLIVVFFFMVVFVIRELLECVAKS
eukprot:TRINITY_DN325_c0_g1_i3.p1 TRINITY_DN325_c0_g1~~TRINITY_DN325_c0_g1_i3.p1  ORF type:complete len:223 (-),score=40.43 TRINITY_DN325_c0_g1_i3:260-928(-)